MERYDAKFAIKQIIGGFIILACCLLETVGKVAKSFVWFGWKYKLQIVLGLAGATFCCMFPYLLAGISYMLVTGSF